MRIVFWRGWCRCLLKGHLKVKVFTVISFLLNFCMIREHLPKKGHARKKTFFFGEVFPNMSSQMPDIVRAGFYTDFGHTPFNVSWFKDDGHYLVTKSVGQAELIAAWDPLWLAQCLPIEMLTKSCQRRSRHSAWQILIQAFTHHRNFYIWQA